TMFVMRNTRCRPERSEGDCLSARDRSLRCAQGDGGLSLGSRPLPSLRSGGQRVCLSARDRSLRCAQGDDAFVFRLETTPFAALRGRRFVSRLETTPFAALRGTDALRSAREELPPSSSEQAAFEDLLSPSRCDRRG